MKREGFSSGGKEEEKKSVFFCLFIQLCTEQGNSLSATLTEKEDPTVQCTSNSRTLFFAEVDL